MKEPACYLGDEYWPYSEAPVWMLQRRAGGTFDSTHLLEYPDDFDLDFRKMYAAILLRERGL